MRRSGPERVTRSPLPAARSRGTGRWRDGNQRRRCRRSSARHDLSRGAASGCAEVGRLAGAVRRSLPLRDQVVQPGDQLRHDLSPGHPQGFADAGAALAQAQHRSFAPDTAHDGLHRRRRARRQDGEGGQLVRDLPEHARRHELPHRRRREPPVPGRQVHRYARGRGRQGPLRRPRSAAREPSPRQGLAPAAGVRPTGGPDDRRNTMPGIEEVS